MDDENTDFSPAGWLQEADLGTSGQDGIRMTSHNQDSLVNISGHKNNAHSKRSSRKISNYRALFGQKADLSQEDPVMSGARGPGDSPSADFIPSDSMDANRSLRQKAYHGKDQQHKTPGGLPGLDIYSRNAANHSSQLQAFHKSNVPVADGESTESTEVVRKSDFMQLSTSSTDIQTQSQAFDRPQSADMEISPADMFHPPITKSRPHLHSISAEETQSHHPSTLPQSPASLEQPNACKSPQRSCLRESSHEPTKSYELNSKPTPAHEAAAFVPRQKLHESSQHMAQNRSTAKTRRFTVPQKGYLPPSLEDETASPTDKLSTTATTNSPFPRPGTPRPVPVSSSTRLRQSVEREPTTIHQFVRESTPAYLDRSETPSPVSPFSPVSPVSHLGGSDIEMGNAHTPTPHRQNKHSSARLPNFSGHTYFSRQEAPSSDSFAAAHAAMNAATHFPAHFPTHAAFNAATDAAFNTATDAVNHAASYLATRAAALDTHAEALDAKAAALEDRFRSHPAFSRHHQPSSSSTKPRPGQPFAKQYQTFHKAGPPSMTHVLGYDSPVSHAEDGFATQHKVRYYHTTNDTDQHEPNFIPLESAAAGRPKWSEISQKLAANWPPKGLVRHKRSNAPAAAAPGNISGARVEKSTASASATVRAVSHGRPRKAVADKKQRAVTMSGAPGKAKHTKTDATAGSGLAAGQHRRIPSTDHTAKVRDAEGQGKRRSTRIKQRRSEGKDVLYTE